MVDTGLQWYILQQLELRVNWETIQSESQRRGHNDNETNDVVEDLVFRGFLLAHEIPDTEDESKTWYEPYRLTNSGYQFIEENRLTLIKAVESLGRFAKSLHNFP